MSDLELTGRQKLIYEAFQKINTGEKLREEGLIELNNLLPPDKVTAHKVLRNTGFSKSNLSDDKIAIDRIMTMIDKKDVRVTANYVHKILNLSERRVRRLADKMKQQGLLVEKTSPNGGAKIWTRLSSAPGSARSASYINPEIHADKILAMLRTDGPKTTNTLAKDLKITWAAAKRIIDNLITLKSVRSIKKIGRNGSMCEHWEAYV